MFTYQKLITFFFLFFIVFSSAQDADTTSVEEESGKEMYTSVDVSFFTQDKETPTNYHFIMDSITP